jgi:hypothetical protein
MKNFKLFALLVLCSAKAVAGSFNTANLACSILKPENCPTGYVYATDSRQKGMLLRTVVTCKNGEKNDEVVTTHIRYDEKGNVIDIAVEADAGILTNILRSYSIATMGESIADVPAAQVKIHGYLSRPGAKKYTLAIVGTAPCKAFIAQWNNTFGAAADCPENTKATPAGNEKKKIK